MQLALNIAIIGGGASGLAVLLHLVEKATIPLHISLIEKSGTIGKGTAFGTSSPAHPLNVVANQMGVFAERPDDFYKWLQSHGHHVEPQSYLPRMLYAEYLQDTFQKALKEAAKKGISIEIVQDEAVDVRDGFTIVCRTGKLVPADSIVLAISVPSVKALPFENEQLLRHPRYISNIWGSKLPDAIQTIVMIGSGLTSIDILLQQHKGGYRGKLVILSHSGTFPHAHKDLGAFPPLKQYAINPYPDTCRKLLAQFRNDWKTLQASGHDWRQLIDAVRPHIRQIWKKLPIHEKKQFIRRLFPVWNRHRHRMSPSSKIVVDQLHQEGRLELLTASVKDVIPNNDGTLLVRFIHSGKENEIRADAVINCSGPQYQIAKNGNGLIKALIQKGLIEPDSLGIGLKITEGECLAGKGNGKIFALGALLFGEYLETTAVPEIRQQANSIADAILRKYIHR